MKIKIITKEKYLFDKLFLLNLSQEIKLNKDFINKMSLNRIIKSINRNNKNISVTSDKDFIYLQKNNRNLSLKIYHN